jgi:hypothetical protein
MNNVEDRQGTVLQEPAALAIAQLTQAADAAAPGIVQVRVILYTQDHRIRQRLLTDQAGMGRQDLLGIHLRIGQEAIGPGQIRTTARLPGQAHSRILQHPCGDPQQPQFPPGITQIRLAELHTGPLQGIAISRQRCLRVRIPRARSPIHGQALLLKVTR